MNQIEHICYNCRWCREGGGPGEDCGTWYACCRVTPWHLTRPCEFCGSFRPLPWLECATAAGSRSGVAAASQPDTDGGAV